ncbi:glycoside hydrolase family 31 protein [Phanerochaete carnosa HHB-10118-sp]|uniref:Glycoside hydrolase family 31 protein n=1 Tax=Phanerochaete carnosa (strain HHB-10118-sp) TaxID=650164 RepID=K5WMB6_PHACS|nr:glycoside hydrolase family 31 protein [Phanerochaete carnosa HHB-10118-sp]EKM60299.1 glycoside hydrolase family 31 protein [Phanerochaete carnosa HHB-10118-sp]
MKSTWRQGWTAVNNQHNIPIVDVAVIKQINDTDVVYDTFTRGSELDVWIKNSDGSKYVGQVCPGYSVFQDWFAENTQQCWIEMLTNWSSLKIEFPGI